MASPAYLYTNWITFPEGTPIRLSTLRQHIQEVSAQIAGGDYEIDGRLVTKKSVQDYLSKLLEREKFEGIQVGLTQGSRLGFTQLRARRRP